MATRAELLVTFEAALDGFLLPATGAGQWTAMPDQKSAWSERMTSVNGQHTIETHICYFWDVGALNRRNAQFYVVDRGEAGEIAEWIRGNDPKPPVPDPTFTQEMTAWLASQIDQVFGTLTLRHIESTSANDTIERGTAECIMQDGTAFVRKSVAVWQAAGVWQFKAIT